MALNKQSILRHTGTPKTREVHVPALADASGDDVVIVRGMTVREFEINQERADEGLGTASLLSRCIVDADGSRVFADSDVEALAELPLSEVAPLSRAIADLSGLNDKIKSVDDAVKSAEGNSEPTDGDGTSST